MTGKVDEEALDWAIRNRDPEFDDWDGFTLWLESDPAHAARYEAVAAALADARDAVAALPLPAPLEVANDAGPARRTFLRWSGGAVAAALVGAFGLSLWTDRSQPYAVETAAGEQRTIALADGSEAVMAGGSRLALDRSKTRFAAVERGEVLFRVKHDASDPFKVRAGGLSMTDLGTVFDVKLGERQTRVAVAEGAVMVDPDGARLQLDPGQAVVAAGGTLRRERADDVGGWQAGRLAFDNATLDEVAHDLSRHLGRKVRAERAVAQQRFRGTLDIDGFRDDPTLLGRLLDVKVRVDSEGWTLERNP